MVIADEAWLSLKVPINPHLTLSFIPGKSMSDRQLSLSLRELGIPVLCDLGTASALGARWLAGGLSSDGLVYLFAGGNEAPSDPGELERALAGARIPYLVVRA